MSIENNNMTTVATIDRSRLPLHIAVIMDGNGRWATSRGYDRSAGHVEGVNTVRRITEAASELGIGYLCPSFRAGVCAAVSTTQLTAPVSLLFSL